MFLTRSQDFVYTILLQDGELTMSDLEKRSGFDKVLLNDILSKLIDLNLVENDSKIYRGFFPSEVIDSLILEKTTIDKQLSEFETGLRKYEIYKKDKSLPKVHFWRGLESMSVVYEEAVKSGVWRGIVNIDAVNDEFEEYLDKIVEVLSSKKVDARDLLIDTSFAREYKSNNERGTYQIKLFKCSADLKFDIIILDDRVFFMSFVDHEMLVVEVQSKMIVESQLLMFNFMWDHLS